MVEVGEALQEPAGTRSRTPKSARAVLRLLALLARSGEPVRADDAAARLGKSLSATYDLLDVLCREGFAVHDPHGGYVLADPGRAAAVAVAGAGAPAPPPSLAAAVDELFARTGKRAYLAAARSGRVVIPAIRGRQGVRRIPDLRAEIGREAHALALGKIALSLLQEAALERYVRAGLERYTEHTITDPDVLRAELATIARTGVASDREEYHDDFCCLAVPVFDGRRQPVAALGVSMSAHAFDRERDQLEPVLREVAARAVPAMPENPADLDPATRPAPPSTVTTVL